MRNLRIDGDRLWSSLMEIGRIGETPAGGCRRLALTDEDRRARDLFCRWAREAGCTIRVDPIGNIFARRGGRDDGLPPVMVGSHLDTVPTGGKFDGILGVMTGLEILRTLHDQDIVTEAPVEVAVWTNEEGSRFSPMTLGSSVYTGETDLAFAYGRADEENVTVREALEAIGYKGEAPLGERPIKAYFEVHNEQGPVLESHGESIGIVTGSFYARYFLATIRGEAAHVGPTPMARRKDAMVGAAALTLEIDRIGRSHGEDGRSNAPHIELYPNVRGVIPSEVRLSCDVRHSDPEEVAVMESELRAAAKEVEAARGVSIELEQYYEFGPIHFDPEMTQVLRDCADGLGLKHRDLLTVAGHDAVPLNRICPTALLFVASCNGISHNENEACKPEDVTDGANVLFQAVLSQAGLADAAGAH
ncbi:Zn-dependent hydrolase [Aquibaculum arenosum]|uniref:Zn-dependent hydrolase n=1 Tax=Aquibaculum arenosum TaxID=3032591 RepID=A0ABT5YR53_9PROT|nr:Zn-dependent hydrolase [Fodinicurvata sp. CAU 1616]MDF2097455.1 Zn-dependent hydrolase [Fodinicurvata sp. CAU 1616]